MLHKTISGPVSFKADGQTGEFTAVFSRFAVKDADGDVTNPDAFTDGEETRVSAWGHGWGNLPVGKGVVHFDGAQAWLDGRFFLETAAGREHYETVKALGPLQEWSYGYKVLDSAPGVFEGEPVRILKRLHVIEVSPVMQGAGVGTHTAAIKRQQPTEIVVQLPEGVDVEAFQVAWAAAWKGIAQGGDPTAIDGTESKEGRRNSTADQGRMGQIIDLMDQAMGMMRGLMGSTGTQSEGPPEGEAGKSSKPSGQGPSTYAQQAALELLSLEIE